jgi:subtilase family serine protease
LIEAFDDPTIRTDLQLFDKTFGLPDPQLKVIAPFGVPPFDPKDPQQTGFAGETALDVEWTHVMAPDAAIVVVQAKSTSLTEISKAIQFAVQKNIGDVISMSFGAGEQCVDSKVIEQLHAVFQQARTQKQTLLASAGDSGSAAQDCDVSGNLVTLTQGASHPASDPLVTSVGGTTLLAGKTGVYQSETTWNEADKGHGATGGGFSSVFAKPDFQQNITGATRGIADLSFDADPLSGVPVVAGSLQPGKTLIVPIGGTSLGAPAVAGMTALFDQAAGRRLGFLNNALYRISENAGAYAKAFHDVQSGNNPFVFKDNNGNVVFVDGFNAAVGWDPPTGVGTPNAVNLAKILPQFIKENDGKTL